jgi:hypothetical protein
MQKGVKVQIYDCKVRIGGSLFNEVRKAGATAAEVHLLKHIHGHDAVVEIRPVGAIEIDDEDERERLGIAYSLGDPSMLSPDAMPGAKLVRDLFGVESMPLPQKLKGFAEIDTIPDEPVIRKRVGRPNITGQE